MTSILEKIELEGTFGDGIVPVHIMRPGKGRGNLPLVIMLHGVHGCASPEPGNKYGELARMLNEAGAVCAIVETSRIRRDRATFCEDREAWAHAAFRGKTFSQDHADAVAGIEAAAREAGSGSVWIMGFSLGGIHAMLAFGEKDGLSFAPFGITLGGTGYRIRSEAEGALSLPILNTIPHSNRLIEAAKNLRTGSLVAFYGSLDSTFPEETCRKLVDLAPLPAEKKRFIVIEGVDHAFRTMRGAPSIKPLEIISSYMIPLLF